VETDSPYLTPVPHRGKRNEPAYVCFVAETIAKIKKIDLQEVARATTDNATRLFRI
jgi:TatD DNase family protein